MAKGRILLRAIAEKNAQTQTVAKIVGDTIGGVWFPWNGEEGKWVDIDMTEPEAGFMEDNAPRFNESGVDPARIRYMASPLVGYIELKDDEPEEVDEDE